MSNYQLAQQTDQIINIKVAGVGGAGDHTVNQKVKINYKLLFCIRRFKNDRKAVSRRIPL